MYSRSDGTSAFTSAMTTNIVNVFWVRMLASRPMFCDVLGGMWTTSKRHNLTRTISSTRPLQLIRTPIVELSRHNIPQALAASVPPTILPANAMAVTPNTYAQAVPSFRRPRLVFSPESAKYRGRKMTEIRSSIFSVSLMAKPESCGHISPTRKAPKMG